MEYTIEVYKADKRKKEGTRLVNCIVTEAVTVNDAEAVAIEETQHDAKLSYKVHASYREVRNVMTGKIVKEHYLTPWCCSVASETYWSM